MMGTINVRTADREVAAHFTMMPNDVVTVTFGDDLERIEIVSRDGAADIWYTLDGSTPAIGGARSYVLPAGAMGSDERQPYVGGPTVVRLISPGSPAVSVQQVA